MFRDKDTLPELFERNRAWILSMTEKDPEFFINIAYRQTPLYLWIGCSDSRVPANEIVGMGPGELFVHRNVANLVIHSDMNCLAVIQYAVDVLKIKHVIVCGHYGCGGVEAAMDSHNHGLVENWLRHIRDVEAKYEVELSAIPSPKQRFDRLCELNAIEQAINAAATTVVQQAWKNNQEVSIHSWMYSLCDGSLKALAPCISSLAEWRTLRRDPFGAVTGNEAHPHG